LSARQGSVRALPGKQVFQLKEILESATRNDALLRMTRRLEEGCRVLAVNGLAGGSVALAVAKAILTEKRSVAVITGTNIQAQNFTQELRFLLGLLSAQPPEIAWLPGPEVDPYRGMSLHPEIAAARSLAIWQLLRVQPLVLIASASAAVVRLPGPQHFLYNCLHLRKGEDFSPEHLRERLQEMGYVEDDPVTEAGEFSLRGGILDVFPPNRSNPVRLEFFGDNVESLREFDPDTQRSVAPLTQAEVIPMRECCANGAQLRRWAEEAPKHWSEPFLAHLEEELGLARQGEPFPAVEFHLPLVEPLEHSFFDCLTGFRLIVCEREALEVAVDRHNAELYERFVDCVEAHKPVLAPEQIYLTGDQFRASLDRLPRMEIEELSMERAEAPPLFVSTQSTRRYHGNVRDLISDLKKFLESKENVIFLFPNLGRAERMRDILQEYEVPSRLCVAETAPEGEGPPKEGVVLIGVGQLRAGFYLPSERLRVLTAQDIFDEMETPPTLRRFRRAQRHLFLSDFRDLKAGDYVVHMDHGIGQFCGLKTITLQDGSREFVLLTYQDGARLYVPVERLDLVQKYSSVGGTHPPLDRLGGTSWERTKSRIKRSMRDMAGELLRLYAQRQMVQGFAFSLDTTWQQEFEDAFEFDLTPDQAEAIAVTKKDMEAVRPMDRLLCGDVGYGKTEVAMRAALKAVMDGKQVAVLAPTTVLAFQHYNTFRRRFAAFPIRIELLSRFRDRKEQKKIVEELDAGAIDIVIGTHRLLSKDVAFKDLGLVIVDEEQRFGVAHKERLKALKTRVDFLTLTATPIPRTLNMALMGLRDMSIIETPPKNRLAIQTSVVKFSTDVIRSAIELELARKGQVYFVHNRVETIQSAAAMVQRLVPRARIGIAHGQMSERELERVMLRFVQEELDILVATTIIENGLDIPRVNTIVINRADLYGLSQLYQLRGRVGRSDRRAYAYLLVAPDEILSEVARKRLAAIREFSDLGTGFRVAALDLEIRGAGNLLGAEQHGQINAVGFDLYCHLLEQTVEELSGEKVEEELSTALNLNLDIRIPEDYIADSGQRLRMYKRISSAKDNMGLDELQQEMVDRYGKYPEPVENLFQYARLRLGASELQIQGIERSKGQIFLRFVDQSKISIPKLLELVRRDRRASLSPQGLLALKAPDGPPSQIFALLHRVLDQIHR
jgi:transcription-repair coupling factor (superfamily II helicase)